MKAKEKETKAEKQTEKKAEKQIDKKEKKPAKVTTKEKDEFGYKLGSVNHLFAKLVMSASKEGISSVDIMAAPWNKRKSRLWGSMKDMIEKNLIKYENRRMFPLPKKEWRLAK